jgi:putative flavoprotein involved in K+ transport
MDTTNTIVVGAGQAGLALSHCLTDRRIDHVVLERGRIGERWRSETWDSLRLLTPNGMSRLPGWTYDGPDPNGFMSASDFVAFIEGYAHSFDAPIEQESPVESVEFDGETYVVTTAKKRWRGANVVIATGWCDLPAVPTIARRLSGDVHQLAPSAYRKPSALPDGGVLVVGASATGMQLADELRSAGRDVVLAVGNHSRLPRRYRGIDIYWWLERIGSLDETIDETPDPIRARREPSLQLVGRADGRSLDLPTLQHSGVRLTGRLVDIDTERVEFASDLAHTVAAADCQMRQVLARIDRHIDANGLTADVLRAEPAQRLRPSEPLDRLDLKAAGISTVIWATGHRRVYPWLHLSVFDAAGEIRQVRGVTPVPGLYVLGQRFQHFRNSNFIGGVGRDAAFVAGHIAHTAYAKRPTSPTLARS